MVPCNVRGVTINNVMTPVVIDLIHLNVVTDSKHLKYFELLEQENQDLEIEGYDTMGCMRTFCVIFASYVVFRTHDGQLVFRGLVSVMYGNKLEQRDILTLDVGCAMLCICKFWGAIALKHIVAMCLMKYYPFTLEH